MPYAMMAESGDAKRSVTDIAGGDWLKGKAPYHGKATCFTCRSISGDGHAAGPNLGNTNHPGYASVLRDI